MSADRFKTHFPVPYAHWYATCLLAEAGHGLEALKRLGVAPENWRDLNNRYALLHFANMGWVASAYASQGLPSPASDEALYAHLLAGGGIVPVRDDPLSLRRQLAAVRKGVEADPRIGPFADTDWVCVYIGERTFPTLRYLHDGESVFADGYRLADRNGKPIAGIDPHSFRLIGERWLRDDKRVYGQGETPTKTFWFVARAADPDSFAVLNERYGSDKAAGYYITNRRLPTTEPGTFQIVSYYYGRGQKPGIHVNESHYAKDSEKVYAYGSVIEGAHAPSFVSIGDEGRYFADKNRIYWEKTPIDVDYGSFVCASEAGQFLAFDKDRPYARGRPQSISAEFEHWRKFFDNHPELTETWWHKENARREKGAAAPSALESLGGPFLSDGARVLVVPRVPSAHGPIVSLDHFDHDSFRHLVDTFGVDKAGLRYFEPAFEPYGRPPIKGGDPDSFAALGEGWYRDKNQAYYLSPHDAMATLVVVRADLQSFETIGGVYARDGKGLIAEGVRKRGIDNPDAVQSLGTTFARMGDSLLYRGRPVKKPGKVDPATARSFHPYLLIDADGHMLISARYRKPIAGLDPQSLAPINHSFAADLNRVYAISFDAVIPSPDIDRATVASDGDHAVTDKAGRYHLAGDTIRFEPH